jgi:hypothetical protein
VDGRDRLGHGGNECFELTGTRSSYFPAQNGLTLS